MENKTKIVNGKEYELTDNGGGCSVCDLRLIGLNKFVHGEVSECVKLTDGICSKNMGSYFKLKSLIISI